jgi:hypothetical protein
VTTAVGDGLKVTPGELVKHAGAIDHIAGQVSIAAQAAQTVHTDSQAYGRLCQFIPSLLAGPGQAVAGGLADAASTLHAAAATLVATSGVYQSAAAAELAKAGRIGR